MVFGSLTLAAQTATVPAITGSRVTQPQAQQALDFHNAKRSEVGAPPLQWSVDLASLAQHWADHLAVDNQCQLQHNPNNTHGENLFGGSGAAYTALFASQSWYSEIKDYHYGVLSDTNWSKTGHYTQMVWKSTTKVGIGQAACPDGGVVIAAEYDPPGNYMGQKPY